MFVDIIKVFDL